MSTVEVAREGEVAVLRLNRPEKLNAISSEVERALHEALASDAVRTSGAVIVAGEGRAFSAGADISEFEGRSPEDVLRYYHETGGVYEELAALPQPTIAAIHGYCLGGALELALALDFRIADETAVFGFPEVSLGILASSGGLHRVTRLLGPARAKELFLLAERFGADEALRAGVVTEVVAEGTGARAGARGGGPARGSPPRRGRGYEAGDRCRRRGAARGSAPDRAARVRRARADAGGARRGRRLWQLR